MSAAIAQRLLTLAALALLAGLIAAAVVEARGADTPGVSGASAPGETGWYSALAAPRPPAGDAERTSCSLILTSDSLGITHPVLPCGAKLILRYRGEAVLSEVIDNDLTSNGRQLEVTEGLARILGLDGTQEIQWRYATR